jgi:glutamyl-Q tRNA(Asp) synthetase
VPTPNYMHLPVAVNARGEKLSKQTLAAAVDPVKGAQALADALAFLGNPPPPKLRNARPADVWSWAIERWDAERVPRNKARASGV